MWCPSRSKGWLTLDRPKFRPGASLYSGLLPISKIKDKLNEYVDAVAQTQDQITIIKNGAAAAVLVGADE